MKQIVIDALARLGFVEGKTNFLQGTHNPAEAYPDTFTTFWVNSTDDGAHFDNETLTYDWSITVILYSNDPAIVNTKPDEIRAEFKAAGFIPQGKGNDVPSDNAAFTGWAMDFIYTEHLQI